ncbi:MAG: acyloxyacyl hydrolase [Flavobacterium sp.]|nr:acyloxyacyl hydrolase [Flavobacterium sp.]
MQNKLVFILQLTVFSLFFIIGSAQSPDFTFAGLEYSIGKTSTANVNFPSLSPQQGVLFTIGTTNNDNSHEWKRQLNYPETGVTFSYVSLGNSSQLGNTFSVVPYINFKVMQKWSSRYNLKVGLGASYFPTIYDEIENPNNKAISTHFTWAFRSNLYYDLMRSENYHIKLGLGYFHNSNGHTRLPNNGLNTFLFSVYSQLNFNKKEVTITEDSNQSSNKTSQRYFTTRFGLGQRVLSKYNNDSKDVYAFSASTGKIINKTFKYGYGLYYRLYKDYYDYIHENGTLVAELYPEYRDNATWNASNIGVFGSGELLLSHFGIEFELGINLHKPSYKFDWQINEEKYVDGQYQLGELNWYYKLKKTVSSRLGAKLYAINTNKVPRHNVFLGAFINSNFGQADFSELTLGYMYSLPIKSRMK